MKTWLSLAASTVIALTVVGCNGEDGAAGTNGADGINGTNGTNGTNSNISLAALRADFGKKWEDKLYIESEKYFGFDGAKKEGYSTNVSRKDADEASDAILLADGLTASFLTREAANKADLFNFYPTANPTHIFSCIEGGSEEINSTTAKRNPSVQSWDLETGEVKTVLRGMERCDGLRATPWGTLVATEETNDGALYEIIDPLNVENHQIIDRANGTVVDGVGSSTPSTKIIKRQVMAEMAWEGLTVLESGIIIGGDELRPGTAVDDADGGAIFKFVPSTPRTATGNITDLSESPLVSGTNYAMQVSCKDSKQQFGQGCEVGNATWIEVNAATARADADANGATGYYRPEDLHRDTTFVGEDADDMKFCWTNTGNEGASHFGEIMCAVDSEPLEVGNGVLTTVVNRFIEGNEEFTSVDSLDIHPVTGDIYGIEDHKNGDIWACLKDGADKDIKSDGCVRLLSVKDQSAEPTGFIFSPDGSKAYLSIQHSSDTDVTLHDGGNLVDDYATDDIIVIDGFDFIK